jgi:hypothetical protein
MHGEGFQLLGNTFIATGETAVPIQIEPLGAGTTVANVVVSGNLMQNVWLVLRRAVSGASIVGNTLADLRGGSTAIISYPADGGTPDGIVVTGNAIVNPTTSAGKGVILIDATNYVVSGNAVLGSGYKVPGIYARPDRGVVSGNFVSSGSGMAEPGFRLTPSTPPMHGSTCSSGEIRYDAQAIYVCTAPNVWKSARLSPNQGRDP